MGSNFLTRNWTWDPAFGAWGLSHWTTKDVPKFIYLFVYLKYSWFTMLYYLLLHHKVTQCACVCKYIYVYMYYMYTYMYICIHVYICIYMFTHTHTLFYFLFHHGLPRDIEYSSLCCTVVPCCLSIVLILLSTWLFWLNREEDRELREQKSLTSPLLP